MNATTEVAFDLIPIRAGAKFPPEAGTTGYGGDSTWRDEWNDHTGNWGARLRPGYVGIDIDGAEHGNGKTGPASIAAAEADLGALPLTAYSTRHGEDSPTRIAVYRIPEGVTLTEAPLEGVELIQHHHRFMAVAPSKLDDGTEYQWYDFLGEADGPTYVADLPPAWVEYLGTEVRGPLSIASTDDVQTFLDNLPAAGEFGPRTMRALAQNQAQDGTDSTLLTKVIRGLAAIAEDGTREAVDLLHDALEGPYVAEYGPAAWDRQWRRALEKAVAKVAPRQEPAITPEPAFEADSAPFRIVTRAELKARPKPEWLVDGLVQGSGVVILAGEGGLGKTFLSLDWAARIATGTPWHGRRTKPGRVLYVAAEGAEFFDDRLSSWEKFNKTTVPDERLQYVEEGFNLSTAASVDYMREVVAAEGFDLIVLDTLSQLSDVDSENDNAQLARVLRAAKSIREARPGSTVLIVHHVNKSERGRVRGAGAIRNNADAVIVARAKGEGFMLSTKVEHDGKQKNAPAEVLAGFRLASFGGGAVIERDEYDPDGDAIDSVLDDGEWHRIGDFLDARGDKSEATSKRLRRKLDARENVESTGSTSAREWRHLDINLDT